MNTFFKQICWNLNNKSSIIIDDNRVSYAYLLYDKNIIGDVWLYNRVATPISSN